MSYLDTQRAEISANFAAFQAALPRLLPTHAGRYAVLRHTELLEIFDSYAAALAYCGETFSDRLFSIQEITSESLSTEGQPHAGNHGTIRSGDRAYR
jgi:hypothetical protein